MTNPMTTEAYRATALEKDVRKACTEYLRLQGWDYYSNAQTGMGVTRGLPDITAFKSGRVCWIEFKRASGGKLSKAQLEIHARLRRQGCVVIVATCVEDLYVLGDERQMILGCRGETT